MQFEEIKVKMHLGTLASDRCARSGLKAMPMAKDGVNDPGSFSTLYTTNFEEMSVFYREMLGEQSLRIDGDGLLVFGNSQGSVVIKRVGEDSQFAKLAGRQSLGMVGTVPNLSNLAKTPVGEELEWDTKVIQLNDPDGNLILLAEPEPAQASVRKFG